MRICLYTSTALPNLGGQEMVVDALARHMVALGHQPLVLAPQPRMFWRGAEAATCYTVVRHPRFWSMRRGVEAFRKFLVQLHHRAQFDVIHCHGIYPPAYLAAISKDALNVPVVVTSHGEDVEVTNLHLAEPRLLDRYRRALAQATAFVAISEHTRQGLCRLCVDESRIANIPNGVEYDSYAVPVARPESMPDARDYILFLGRLEERKGVHVLLRAWSQLRADRDLTLLIAGDGSQRQNLEKQARDLRLERVQFLGTCTGNLKKHLLQNAIASVVPSIGWESFGLTVLEAQAAACPVICSDLIGMRDLVVPNETGWRVPPGCAESLRRALEAAVSNRAETRRIGRAAAQAARAFDWRSITLRHLALYQRLLNRSNEWPPSVRVAA